MQKVRMRAWSVSVIIVLVLIIDQVIKFWVKTTMALGEEFKITEWFRIHFIENKGMAFGMDFIGTWPLTLFRVMAVALFIYLLVKIVKNPERYPFGLAICLAFVIAGAAGNIIDNCIYGLILAKYSFQCGNDNGLGNRICRFYAWKGCRYVLFSAN